ncbi:MAG: glycosyltransferase family 2 protein [Bacteroidales bacterium]|nr:glycosyltransferase family 2 protein [Bacteroidales bacterium]
MTLHIAIPVMQELELLPTTLDCIANQCNAEPFHVYICVNQPEKLWDEPEKQHICAENQAVLQMLSQEKRFPLTVFDYASPGKGWKDKKSGVGHARKVLFDHIAAHADEKDVIVSLDADTTFGSAYFSAIRKMFRRFPKSAGLMVPYYHRLTSDEITDRAILRYEIYMRCYALNLCRIGSPYNFTALGSAMAIPVGALKAVGGITPYSSGEDFYLAQKLRKYGDLLLWLPETVFPSARLSDRVAFGTGPAMIKGVQNNWESYPIYPPEAFEPLQKTFALFPKLFQNDCPTPIDDFLSSIFPNQNIWQPLRKNFKTERQFIKACHQKIDGLRTLQFLRSFERKSDDNESLIKNLHCHCDVEIVDFHFEKSPVELLNTVRNYLYENKKL